MSDAVGPNFGQPIASDVSGEVRAIIRAAERLAETIREDADRQAAETLRAAETEARRRLQEAHRQAEQVVTAQRHRGAQAERVMELSTVASDELAAVRRARQGLDAALQAMEAAVERIARADVGAVADSASDGEGAAAAVTGAAQDGSTQPRVDESPIERPSSAEHLSGTEPPARPEEVVRGKSGARLVAAQMALAGSTRGEVAAHLRRTFELPALHEVLDEVFERRGGGPGSPESSTAT